MVYLKIGKAIESSASSTPQKPNNWSLFSSVLRQPSSFKGRRTGGAAAAVTASLPIIFLLLDLWRVPIIILIATTRAQPICAVSISAVSISSNEHLGNSSDNYDTPQKPPNKLTLNSNDGGDGSGLLSLSFGGLVFNTNYQQQPKDTESTSAKKRGIVKRGGGGETRITSNQDVTTLALAVDNSSSVAIANINSSWNNVYVTIGTPTSNQFQYPPQYNKK